MPMNYKKSPSPPRKFSTLSRSSSHKLQRDALVYIDFDASASHNNRTESRKHSKTVLTTDQGSPITPKHSRKLARSKFYTALDNDQGEKVYPASCTHAAKPPGNGDAMYGAERANTKTNQSDMPKSLSVQDLSSLTLPRKSKKRAEKYATLRGTNSQRLGWSVKLKSNSKLSVNDSTSDDFSDISITGSRKQLNGSFIDVSAAAETHYQSYDNVGLYQGDEASPKMTQDKCTRSSYSYTGDVWREVAPSGGVIQIIGCDVSLHVSERPEIFSNTCMTCISTKNSKNARQRKISANTAQTLDRKTGKLFSKKLISRSASAKHQQSGPILADRQCPITDYAIVDGRMILGLEDPPSCKYLNEYENSDQCKPSSIERLHQAIAIAGPAVRLDLRDKRSIENGCIVQLPTNAVLHESSYEERAASKEYSESLCFFACLQSTNPHGPWHELTSCYLYGESLQVNLDPTRMATSNPAIRNCQVHLVPIVKRSLNAKNNNISVWEGIERKTFHIGIYGPRYTYEKSTFCASLSTSGFVPAFLNLKLEEKTYLTLKLLASYSIVVHRVQGYSLSVHTSSSSPLTLQTDLSECFFSESEIKTEARINRTFVLKYCLEQPANPNGKPPVDNTNHRFLVQLKGLRDNSILRLKCKCSKLKTPDFPSSISPQVAKRLAANMETSPTAIIESKLHSNAFQWLTCQSEDLTRFHESKCQQMMNREVFGVKLANTLKATNSKNKNPNQSSCFLQHPQDEYLPILNRYPLLIKDESGNKKEWWVGYYKHRIGFVRTTLVRVIDYDEFATWHQTRVLVGKLVEAAVAPVLQLKAEQHVIRKKLICKVQNWAAFASALCFGESFAAKSINVELSDSVKEEKAVFYLQKYMDYCTNSGKLDQFHYIVMKALLYSEHFDLVVDLATDMALLNTAMTIDKHWIQLATFLFGSLSDIDYQCNGEKDDHDESEEEWRPVYQRLCFWRERFDGNHKGALFALHQAVSNLPETETYCRTMLNQLVILTKIFETLCQYDTTL